jgi:nucleotide-binding universal stress UspA family protein
VIGHILVAFDGSESARRAASFAHDLAIQTGARITLLLVVVPARVLPIAPLDAYLVEGISPSNEELQRVKELLDKAEADLPRAQVEKAIEIGRAADTICEQAAKRGADLIVVGARGLGTGGRWLLGSVSDRVVHQAGRPVTVVH